jgi:hypothetical protein
VKSAERHVFNQAVECLQYCALGDVSVRILALKNLVDEYGLDFKIIPPRKPQFYRLWRLAFGDRVVLSPDELEGTDYETARMHAPTRLDWQFGSAGFNVFESIYWENGFFRTANLRIKMMSLIRCRPDSGNVMIYPNEHTDGNAVFNSAFWTEMCGKLRNKKYRIYLLGDVRHTPLQEFYRKCSFDRVYQPTVDNLIECINHCCLAIGGSTGPTWTCLLSDIPQIVLESKRSPHGYWFFERCRRVLEKDLKVLTTMESVLS